MYYAYCLIPTVHRWTPATRLQTVAAVFAYCRLQHQLFPEIRITDADDNCVLHIVRHVLYCPLPDGTFSALNLVTGAQHTGYLRMPWEDLPPPLQTAWDAAAEAVRVQMQEDILRLVMTPVERANWDATKRAVRAATPRATPAAGRDEPQTPAPHGPAGPV